MVLWRWRYEFAIASTVAAYVALLVRTAGTTATVALTAAIVLSVAIALRLSPAIRGFVWARAYCVITPHRVRTGCAQARIHSRTGRLPFVLLTRAAPDGERVLLWCRAGTSAHDFVSARAILTAACWASEIRVNPSRRHAQIVTLDVVRPKNPVRPRPQQPIRQLPVPPVPHPASTDQPVRIPAPRAPAD